MREAVAAESKTVDLDVAGTAADDCSVAAADAT